MLTVDMVILKRCRPAYKVAANRTFRDGIMADYILCSVASRRPR
jgi:hypothetical protein